MEVGHWKGAASRCQVPMNQHFHAGRRRTIKLNCRLDHVTLNPCRSCYRENFTPKQLNRLGPGDGKVPREQDPSRPTPFLAATLQTKSRIEQPFAGLIGNGRTPVSARCCESPVHGMAKLINAGGLSTGELSTSDLTQTFPPFPAKLIA